MLKIIEMRGKDGTGLADLLAGRDRAVRGDVVRVVEEIIENVRKNGDKAVLEYTRMFDGVDLDENSIKVPDREIEGAYGAVDPKMLDAIRKSRDNIAAFHERQKENSWFITGEDGILLGQMLRPLESVGIYVPGGSAVLTSSVLMNALPAKVAGVSNIVMATPPGKNGKIDPALLVAARESGVSRIYRIGGAQAVAALAFGTKTVPKVEKITGPGNIYVSTAKKLVFGYCGIDMIAGPSEIMIVADETGNPAYIAADLLSQAEHDPMSASVLVTTSRELAESVAREVEAQYGRLSRKNILDRSLNDHGAIIIAGDIEEAMDIVNRMAPEHLELCVADPFSLLACVKNAGAVFLGNWSPEPLGDYFAGPNHVLPTGGTARFFSPLGVSDFMKKSSVISYTRKALLKAGENIIRFAEHEKLDGHANAIRVRINGR